MSKKHVIGDIERDYLLSLPVADRLLAVWRVILGAEAFDTASRINPTEHAIPQHDWESLCGSDMNWVNVGPSAYAEGGVR